MSILGYTFVTGLMHEMGWPRKSGLLRREYYDAVLLDAATRNMIEWAAALGAGRPKTALRMIAEMLPDRGWNGDGAPMLSVALESFRDNWNANPEAGPHEIVQPASLTKHYARVTPEQLREPVICNALEQYVLEACLWGLANRDRFIRWYNEDAARRTNNAPTYLRLGLNIELPSDVNSFFDQCEELVHRFEQIVHPLPSVPAELSSDLAEAGIILS